MRKRKTLILILATIAMSLFATFALACGGGTIGGTTATPGDSMQEGGSGEQGSDLPHTHEYGEWIVATHATCEADGSKVRTCISCNEQETEVLPALGHDFGEWEVAFVPSCTQEGEEIRRCSHDYNHVEKKPIAPTGHYFLTEEWTRDATYHWHPATCGHMDEVDGKAEHVFDHKIDTVDYLATVATCTNRATYYYSCECGYRGYDTFESGECTPHITVNIFKAPTCTEPGEEYGVKCGDCNTILVSALPIPALGHNYWYQPWITNETGHWHECLTCGESGTPIAHNLVEIPAVAATCLVAGSTAGSRCVECEFITKAPSEIAALGHDFAETVSIDVTHHWYACNNNCGITKDKVEHNFEEDNFCTVCDRERETPGMWYAAYAEDGTYSYNDKKTAYYAVAGISIGNRESDIYIPSTYMGKPVTFIRDSAFRNHIEIESVFLPDSITSIGNSAFSGTGLSGDLTISQNITHIGTSAFYGCNNLNGNITIGDSVKSIGANAFSYCKNIKEVSFGKSLETIGKGAFACCYSITGDLVLPSTLKSIGEEAFYDCNNITGEVKIPDAITIIEWSTFAHCEKISNVVIPNNVTTLYGGVFERCTNLSSITLGKGIEEIGIDAFESCDNLTKVNYTGDVASWCNIEFANDPDSSPLYFAQNLYINDVLLEDLVIPDSVTKIGHFAFRNCTGIKSVVIGKGVATIGQYAFANCKGITNVKYTGDFESWCKIDFYSDVSNPVYYSHNINMNNEPVNNPVIPDSITFINKYAFINCANLTGTLTLGNNIEKIGDAAFYGCEGLTGGLTIPNSVEEIGERAFYNCTGFNGNLSISIKLKSIASSTFYNCDGLTGDLIIPDSVTSIGYDAFYGCRGFNGNFIIGQSVESIGLRAFNSSVRTKENLVIPDSVKSIDAEAFEYCSFGNLTLGNGLISIGKEAFSTSVSTGDLTISDSVEVIGEEAFSFCGEISGTLTIGKNVKSIGKNAFRYCSALSRIRVNENNTTFTSVNNCLIEVATKTLLTGCKNSVIPNDGSIEIIADNAFSGCTGLTGTLVIPNSVVTIGANAFGGCTGLTGALNIPDSVETIGASAFNYCQEIESISIGKNVKSLGNGAFYGCINASGTVNIPDGVDIIKRGLFHFCYKLSNVVLPDGITAIEENAFTECVALQSITIPESVKTISLGAFINCTNIRFAVDENNLSYKCMGNCIIEIDTKTIVAATVSSHIPNDSSVEIIGERVYNACYGLNSIEISNSIKSIEQNAFGRTSLRSVTLGNGVESVGEDAFNACYNIQEVYYAGTIEDWEKINFGSGNDYLINATRYYYSEESPTEEGNYWHYYGVVPTVWECNLNYTLNDAGNSYSVSIGECTYYDIEIPAEYNGKPVTTIAQYGFMSNTLRSIILPNTITTIEDFAFSPCNALRSIIIPDSVKSIGENAFYNCRSLNSLVIGNGVETIATGTFKYCRGLASVTIGSKVTSIASSAFENCENLFEIYNCSSLTITAGTLSNGKIGLYAKNIYTPKSGASKIENINGYLFYNDQDEHYLIGYLGKEKDLILPVTEYDYVIPQFAFAGNIEIRSVVMPDNVTSIGSYVFNFCSNLKSVVLGSGLSSIGERAFAYCSGLESVSIENNAKYKCVGNSLIEIETKKLVIGTNNSIMPDDGSVETIATYSFDYLENITSIVISKSVKTIENYAFYVSSNIDAVYYTGTAEEWAKIADFDNSGLSAATKYYYSEEEPTEEGNYWHYVNGVATKWETAAA